jgi:hypothetical protein
MIPKNSRVPIKKRGHKLICHVFMSIHVFVPFPWWVASSGVGGTIRSSWEEDGNKGSPEQSTIVYGGGGGSYLRSDHVSGGQ